MNRSHLLITSLIITVAMALTACGGSSSSGGGTPAAATSTITGSVATSTGTIAQFEGDKPFMLAAMDFIISQSMAAITGLTGVPNATVELVRILDNGTQVPGVLASATTDSDGNYTLTLPSGVEPSGDLVVQIKGDTETLRAVVSTTTGAIDINPVSQFILNTLIDEGLTLAQLNVEEIQELVEEVDQLDIIVPSSVSVADAITAIGNDTTVTNAISSQVTAVANTALINGAWDVGGSVADGQMLVFYPNGFYLVYSVDAQDCPSGGVEYGTYTYDGTQLELTATLDENGQCGLVGLGPELPEYNATITNEGNQINLTSGDPEDGTASFARVTDGNPDSIVGGWDVGGSVTNPIALVFYPNGNFAHWQDDSDDSNCSPFGIEYGTYSLDTNSNTLSGTALADPNDCGVSGNATTGPFTAQAYSVADNVLQVTDFEIFSADRLETSDGSGPTNTDGGSSAESLSGAYTDGAEQPFMLVFYPNGFYMHYQDCTDTEEGVGVEYGTYQYDGATLTSSQIVDENGGCGLTDFQNGVEMTVGTGELNFNENGNLFTLTAVDGGPGSIVGAWDVGGSINNPIGIVFYDNGTYTMWQDDSNDSNCGEFNPGGGVEYGTYTFDGSTLIATETVDENASCGLTDVSSLTVSGDTIDSGDGDILDRL